ncbi:MAG: hypothetical protein C4536_02345 [Actinobacteria bacterium]|jgi:hypothetical protein|nr:MAG: hypothetical protein C4536_02345 [Actinomycetota bacterium]
MSHGFKAYDMKDMCRKAMFSRKIVIAALLGVAALVLAAGCGGNDPAAWLTDCGEAINAYAQDDGYLHFVQEKEYRLETLQGDFEQQLRVEGDIIFPASETYEYSETATSTQEQEQQENTFSYLTLDGGENAYVMGERLSAELGVLGWVYYTPQPGQNRYFDYAGSIAKLTGVAADPEWLGYEDLGGERCAHIRYSVTGQELIELRLQEDPTLAEQLQGVDLSEVMGELVVELWIREADRLPQQVDMTQSVSMAESASSTTHMLFLFSGYGEVPPLRIEAPAFYNEAV